MKRIFIFLAFFLAPIIAISQPHQTKKEKFEQLILAKVQALPEVKAFFKYGKNFKRKPNLLIEDEPGPTSKYYQIQMGYNGEGMFSTIDRFCVDPKTFAIYYVDFFNDLRPISLVLWRRWKNHPGFYKDHIFKQGKLIVIN